MKTAKYRRRPCGLTVASAVAALRAVVTGADHDAWPLASVSPRRAGA